jgi:hypothetical protein
MRYIISGKNIDVTEGLKRLYMRRSENLRDTLLLILKSM